MVVSTYDRPELLGSLLEHLRRQTLEGIEIIVVDNGSRTENADAIVAAADGDPSIRLLRIEDNRGPARARNVGWRASRRPYIAFTDDDCRPEPRWLETLVDPVQSPRAVVQGTTLPPEGEGPEGWFDRSVRITAWSDRFETCNLLVGTELLHAVDGFDEEFPVAMGEDTDMGFRALAAGAETAFSADAVVRHVWWRQDFRAFIAHRTRHAHLVQMFASNPATRRILLAGFVVRRTHLLVWALVLATPPAVAVGLVWMPPSVVLLWSLRQAHRRRALPLSAPRRLWCALQMFAGYAYETFAFAFMSARHRTLVL